MLESFTDRLLVYMDKVLGLTCSDQEKVRLLMERGCRLLVMEAIAVNSSYYGGEYLLRMEQHSPVRFKYLKAIKRRLKERNDRQRTEGLKIVTKSPGFPKRQVLEFIS